MPVTNILTSSPRFDCILQTCWPVKSSANQDGPEPSDFQLFSESMKSRLNAMNDTRIHNRYDFTTLLCL
ncbi:unnamed protein product [Musa acuminata subsp. malaccensis]|uniref:(wild Malaysian banana) hypothetical protein n=1 Tax=Musa acuminata subsp. malaccensis TaxID=214687 RepID=A0A804KBC1_MUSAM|nr:unnamed protein product [Musa acuminata subsp. malaccensis]